MKNSVNELVEEFKKWLFKEGRADTTIMSYTTDVRKYQEYMSEKANESQPLSRFSFKIGTCARHNTLQLDKNTNDPDILGSFLYVE